MESTQKPTVNDLRAILARLPIAGLCSATVRAFTSDEDGAEYAVWLVDTGREKYVLKRAKGNELSVYETFFSAEQPCVPAYFGSCTVQDATYLLTAYCPGEDLRACNREKLTKAIDALTALQDAFWERREYDGAGTPFETAFKAAEDRGKYLESALLEQAYARFLQVYRFVPRTLCHDDLLPINVLVGEKAVLIDWEYGGMHPYLESFARLIAHGRPQRDAYFYLSQEDRNFAIDSYYEKLVRKHGITREAYLQALEHFLLYEYCEWVMLGNRYDAREDERYRDSKKRAEETAAGILRQRA